ncbi:Monooxygenase aurF [Fusarium oxysporum f. sp. albedinis]|nr:Monooxygenase aurF [Fusarium oxysporum f. sp. albedinis]
MAKPQASLRSFDHREGSRCLSDHPYRLFFNVLQRKAQISDYGYDSTHLTTKYWFIISLLLHYVMFRWWEASTTCNICGSTSWCARPMMVTCRQISHFQTNAG